MFELWPAPPLSSSPKTAADDAFFVRRALKTSGLQHSLVHVTNGAECIACLKGEPPYDDRSMFPLPHLLLLDLKMPLLSGFDVLKWLQRQAALQHIPVVILTGSIVPEDQVATRNLGAKAYYTKQSDPAALTAILKTIDADWLSAGTGLTPG